MVQILRDLLVDDNIRPSVAIAVCLLAISMVVGYLWMSAPPKPVAAPARAVATVTIDHAAALPATAPPAPVAAPAKPIATETIDHAAALPPAPSPAPAAAPAKPAATETIDHVAVLPPAPPPAPVAAAPQPVATETIDHAVALSLNALPAPMAAPAQPVAIETGDHATALPATAAPTPDAVPAKPAVTAAVDRVAALPPTPPPTPAAAPARPVVTETLGRAYAFLMAAVQSLEAAQAKPAATETAARASAVPATAAPTPTAASAQLAVTEALDRATVLFDAGKYAKAKDVLDCFIAAPPAGVQPQELRDAQVLLNRVTGALVDQYRGVEVARDLSTAEESRRAQERDARQAGEKTTLADADRLFHQAQAGIAPEANYAEARRLYAQVASDRTLDAFNSAMEYYDEGQYEGARRVFERLSTFLDQQRAGDPQFKSGLGPDREQRIAECLKRLPDAKDNLALGALLAKGPVASSR